jgi:hypothetical protein
MQQLIDHMDQIDRSYRIDLPSSDSVRIDEVTDCAADLVIIRDG